MFDEFFGAFIPAVTTENLNNASYLTDVPLLLPDNHVFLLDAPAASGKTLVTNSILLFLKLKRNKLLAVSTSSVASQILPGGTIELSAFHTILRM